MDDPAVRKIGVFPHKGPRHGPPLRDPSGAQGPVDTGKSGFGRSGSVHGDHEYVVGVAATTAAPTLSDQKLKRTVAPTVRGRAIISLLPLPKYPSAGAVPI